MENCPRKKIWQSEDNALNKQKSEETKDKCCNQYLTYDVLRLIFEYLNAKELSNASMVCRSWSEAASNEKRTRGPVCLMGNIMGDADDQKHVQLEIINKLRIKPALALFFVHDFSSPGFINRDCYCKALPSNCCTITYETFGVVMENEELVQDAPHMVCVFLPDLPNVIIKPMSLTYDMLERNGKSKSKKKYIEEIKSVLNTPGKSSGISKCLLLFCDRRVSRTAIGIARSLEKCYKASELSVWGGIVYESPCNEENSESTTFDSGRPFTICTAIALVGPIDTWSLIIDRTHNTKERVEQRLKLFRNRISLKRHSLGLMFACCARGESMFEESNVESTIFKKLFPKVPLAGCFGDGEFGTNKIINEPSDNKRKHWDNEMSTVFLIITYD